MKANLRLDKNMRIIGTNQLGLETSFDSHIAAGGDDSAPTPMEVVLQATAACSFLDVVSIMRKKKRTITAMNIEIEGEQAPDYPKVFTKIHIIYKLESPDAEQSELDRAISLSQEKYCNVSAIMKLSGCEVTWESVLNG